MPIPEYQGHTSPEEIFKLQLKPAGTNVAGSFTGEQAQSVTPEALQLCPDVHTPAQRILVCLDMLPGTFCPLLFTLEVGVKLVSQPYPLLLACRVPQGEAGQIYVAVPKSEDSPSQGEAWSNTGQTGRSGDCQR